MTKQYAIAMEIAGTFGMFADPLSGSEAVSYPLPPASACQGMIESVVRILDVEVSVVAVALCNLPEWTNYAFNSHSPLRKTGLIRDNNTLQVRHSVLLKPHFQILATLSNKRPVQRINNAHSMQCQFFRRLRRNQCFHPVSLGNKEFLADYWGDLKTPLEPNFSSVIPSMVVQSLRESRICRRTLNNVKVEKGILRFQEDVSTDCVDGMLGFSDRYLQEQIEQEED